jgi:hypothetical protein
MVTKNPQQIHPSNINDYILVVSILMFTIRTATFNYFLPKLPIYSTQCIHVTRMVLIITTISPYSLHATVLSNGSILCSLWGMNWLFNVACCRQILVKRKTTEEMDWSGWRAFECNGNNKLLYSGQRSEGTEGDCIRSQVHNGLQRLRRRKKD